MPDSQCGVEQSNAVFEKVLKERAFVGFLCDHNRLVAGAYLGGFPPVESTLK